MDVDVVDAVDAAVLLHEAVVEGVPVVEVEVRRKHHGPSILYYLFDGIQ